MEEMEFQRPTLPKKNLLFKKAYNANDNKLSKSTILFFKILHVLVSLDLGFFKYKTLIHKVFFKIVSLCQCLTCCLLYFINILFGNYNTHLRVWSIVSVVQYTIYVIILMFFGTEQNFKKFYDELQIIDTKLVIGKPYRFELKIFIIFLMQVMYKIVVVFRACIPTDDTCLHSIIMDIYSILIYSGVDFILLLIAFIFYLVYCRLVSYTDILIGKNIDLNRYLRLYKSLIDLTENTWKTFEPLFVVALVANIPSITMTLFYTVATIKYDGILVYPIVIFMTYYSFVQNLILTFAPPILSGMLSSQANLLKVELHNILLDEKDEKNANKLKKLIKYIEARPFKFNVWNVIPLNAQLVAIIFNLCVTYFIVLIQLTHIY